MLSHDLIKAALEKALSTGADYAEVFAEHTDSKTISMVSSKVDKIEDAVISGVGIRIFKGLRCISGSTSSLLPEAVLACADKSHREIVRRYPPCQSCAPLRCQLHKD